MISNFIEQCHPKAKILVTDDDIAQRLLLRSKLEKGNYHVIEAQDGFEALEILSQDPEIRVLLTDLAMPRMDGYDLIKSIREKELRYTYIIVLTSLDDRESLLKALSLGADDYLIKPVFPDELDLRLRGGTRLLRLESQEALLFSMAKLAEQRSGRAGNHLERIQAYVKIIARYFSKHRPHLISNISLADEIARVSPLYDLGKVTVPDDVLRKPPPLSSEEYELYKMHTIKGSQLIREIYNKSRSYYLWLAYEIAMFHHEQWDGNGYPLGLKGEHIPVPARIMALADFYEEQSMSKGKSGHQTIKNMIIDRKETVFDPHVVEAFLNNEDEWITVTQKYEDVL